MAKKQVSMAQAIGGWFALEFPYDADVVAGLKERVPSWARSWSPEDKRWTVSNLYRRTVETLLRETWYDFADPFATKHQDAPPPSGNWAESLFQVVPKRLHEPVYKAMVRALHPDVGGDAELMKQLNVAMDRLRGQK